MPAYDYDCAKCGMMEVWHSILLPAMTACPKCGSKKFARQITLPALVKCKDSGWENENGGKGRWISQLGKETDPASYCRSRSEVVDKAKRQGFQSITLD